MVTKKRKTIKKRKAPKKTSKPKTKSKSKPQKDIHIERVLVENFVSLQKVMTNLSVKFDSLTNQISKLLELFEISAKSLAEKDIKAIKSQTETKEILNKMDDLFNQNKTIAKGLTLMHEKLPGEEIEPEFDSQRELTPPKYLDKKIPQIKNLKVPTPIKNSSQPKEIDPRVYERSITDI